MFGYIKPFVPQLKVCEHDLYKAVYCGVCHCLGHNYGLISRFTLSYDFTFVAMLYGSLHGETTYKVSITSCPFNPLKKRASLFSCDASLFSCDAAMLLLWDKNIDNIDDSGFLKSLAYKAMLPFTNKMAQRAKEHEPQLFSVANNLPQLQRAAERDDNFTLDSVCNPTAETLSQIFMLMSTVESEQRILSRLGYMMGRFCYICDAIDDFQKDIKSNSFNPLKNDFSNERVTSLLNNSIAEACSAYSLLPKGEFSPILDNIMYIGLNETAKELINRRITNE